MAYNDWTPSEKKRLRRILINRDGVQCHYCGVELEMSSITFNKKGFSIDHVVPVSEGGTEDPSNLVLACRGCNVAKGTQSYQAYKMALETDRTILFLMGGNDGSDTRPQP